MLAVAAAPEESVAGIFKRYEDQYGEGLALDILEPFRAHELMKGRDIRLNSFFFFYYRIYRKNTKS